MLTRSNVSKNHGTSQEFYLNKLCTAADDHGYSAVDGTTCLLPLRRIGSTKFRQPGEISDRLTPSIEIQQVFLPHLPVFLQLRFPAFPDLFFGLA
jgi:hypothetical protein